jgi:hypothetical protein
MAIRQRISTSLNILLLLPNFLLQRTLTQRTPRQSSSQCTLEAIPMIDMQTRKTNDQLLSIDRIDTYGT